MADDDVPDSGLPPCIAGKKLVSKSRGAVPKKSRLRPVESVFPSGMPLPSREERPTVSQAFEAPAVRSAQARALFPSVCVSFAVQTPPGQSLIHPLGLAVGLWTVNIDTIDGAIPAYWVPPPGSAAEGDCGAGLSAGVDPSA